MVGMVRYDDAARETVTNLKYHRQTRLAFDIALVVAKLADVCEIPNLITWVPTTDRHRTERGFDHAELIARHVGALMGCPHRGLLRRTSKGHQTGRSRQSRLNGARFVASPRAKTQSIWVLDDVWTTGATFHAATQALFDMGACHVMCVAYTHVS